MSFAFEYTDNIKFFPPRFQHENLLFWKKCSQFKSAEDDKERYELAVGIYNDFIIDTAESQVNLNSELTNGIIKAIQNQSECIPQITFGIKFPPSFSSTFHLEKKNLKTHQYVMFSG